MSSLRALNRASASRPSLVARGCRLHGGAWRASKLLRYNYPTLTTYHCSAVGVGGGEKPVVCQALDASLHATPTIAVAKGSGVSAPRLLSQFDRMFEHNHLLRGRIPQPMCSTSRATHLGRRPPQGRRGPTCLKGGRAGSVRRRDRWLIRPGVDPRASVSSGSDNVAAPAARSRRTAVVERRARPCPKAPREMDDFAHPPTAAAAGDASTTVVRLRTRSSSHAALLRSVGPLP